MRDNPNLDLLRSIAVGLVLLSHLPFLDALRDAADTRAATIAVGHVGVALFFAHTALVLMQSLQRHGPAPGPFYIRRAFRIYPLSIAVVLLVALAHWLGGRPLDASLVWSNLLLVQNVTGHRSMPDPLWSLPYEVQMYLVLPWLYLLTTLSGAALRRALAATALVAMAVLGFAAAADRLALLAYVPCFAGGVLAFVLTRRARPRFGPVPMFAAAGAGPVLVPALVAAGAPELPLLWVLCLGLGVLIPLCRPIQGRRLAAAAKTVATYSYGVYLTHVVALAVAFGLLARQHAAVQWAAFAVLLVALSYAVYHAVEAPCIRLGVRLADRLGAARGSSTARA